METLGNSMALRGAVGDGDISNGGCGVVTGLFLKSALTGTLTITGVTTAGGAAQAWVNGPGTSGYVAPPGSGKYWAPGLMYSLSNPGADTGKAVVCWVPT
jgi:hypothetical protein